MREYLFRGKRICEKKNWVEGCLLNLDADSGHVFIVPFFNGASTMPVSRIVEYTSHYVNPETVGQFTGLKDKNGKRIFEGDIIKLWPSGKCYEVKYKSGCFCIGINWAISHEPDCEVIGNRFDNPELLKGGDPS
jgi:uncharacterized phage protein (TIGR01671 family)